MAIRPESTIRSNASAREGVIQDILFAIWRALSNFRGEGSLRAFIARIAANRAVTHVQRVLKLPASTELTVDHLASGPGPEAYAIVVDEKERLKSALRALPFGLSEPAPLALEGLTQEEIARVLGITPNAVAAFATSASQPTPRSAQTGPQSTPLASL
jgi:RNA polymerase sigma-70 factor (ECF subfamily)